MRLLYNLLLVLLYPLILLWARSNPRLREGLSERLGRWVPGKREALKDLAGRCIWLHGVSVGEVRLLFPLIYELRRHHPELPLFITTTTETGHEVLDHFAQAERVATSYFPLADLPWVLARFVSLVRPRMFIAAEAEVWPNLLAVLGARGVRRVLVNARLYLEKKPLWRVQVYRWLYRGFDRICCQHRRAADAFARIGVPPQRLTTTGNIKSDVSITPWDAERVARFKGRFAWSKHLVITAGSTHPGEDELILSAFERVKLAHPEWVLSVVPRHPHRGKEVLELTRRMYLSSQRLSGFNRLAFPLSVLVVDEMGVLADFYQIAEVVILGGTFNPDIGGHNIVEPASLGKPIIVGPYIDSIADEVSKLVQSDAVVPVKDGSELAAALVALVEDSSRRQTLGERAQTVFAGTVGAVAKTAEVIASELDVSTRSEAKSRR